MINKYDIWKRIGLNWLKIGATMRSGEYGSEDSVFIKGGKIFDNLTDYSLVKKNLCLQICCCFVGACVRACVCVWGGLKGVS
jgi:hypothetical protein